MIDSGDLFVPYPNEQRAATILEIYKAMRYDFIIGGHSRTGPPEPVRMNNTIIVEAGTGGSSLVRLEVSFDRQGKIKSYKEALLALHREVPSDPEVESIILRAEPPRDSGGFWR